MSEIRSQATELRSQKLAVVIINYQFCIIHYFRFTLILQMNAKGYKRLFLGMKVSNLRRYLILLKQDSILQEVCHFFPASAGEKSFLGYLLLKADRQPFHFFDMTECKLSFLTNGWPKINSVEKLCGIIK